MLQKTILNRDWIDKNQKQTPQARAKDCFEFLVDHLKLSVESNNIVYNGKEIINTGDFKISFGIAPYYNIYHEYKVSINDYCIYELTENDVFFNIDIGVDSTLRILTIKSQDNNVTQVYDQSSELTIDAIHVLTEHTA